MQKQLDEARNLEKNIDDLKYEIEKLKTTHISEKAEIEKINEGKLLVCEKQIEKLKEKEMQNQQVLNERRKNISL